MPVQCFLVGCYRCLSATVCQECSAVNNYVINAAQLCECDASLLFLQHASVPACVCNPGYYISPNNTCEPMPLCPASNSGCSVCIGSPSTCSVCDTANHFETDPILTALCLCSEGYYFDSLDCIQCSMNLSLACVSCASSTLCLSCPVNFTLTNGDCQCEVQYYLENATTCLPCAVGCLRCASGVTCKICDEGSNFTLSASVCECVRGMFLNGTECVICGSMPGCQDCNTTGCTACDATFGFTLNSSISACECDYGYFINSMDICEQCTTLGCLDCTSNSVCI